MKDAILDLNKPTKEIKILVNAYNEFRIMIINNPRVLNNKFIKISWFTYDNDKEQFNAQYEARILDSNSTTEIKIPDEFSGTDKFSGYIVQYKYFDANKKSILINITQE